MVSVLAEFPVGNEALEPLDLVPLVGQERRDEVLAEDVGELPVGLQRLEGVAEARLISNCPGENSWLAAVTRRPASLSCRSMCRRMPCGSPLRPTT